LSFLAFSWWQNKFQKKQKYFGDVRKRYTFDSTFNTLTMETTTKEKTPIQVVLDSLPQELQDINTISLLLEVEKKSRQNDLLKMMQKIFEHINSSENNDISTFDFFKYIEENT
jgi:hypothetical protein